jgi:hypothetical protein
MNTNRYHTPRPYRRRDFLGVSPAFWSGTVLAVAVLLGILYCLLTHRLPV